MFVGALFNSYSLQYYSFQMSQGRVIDIIIIGGSYSLQYYSVWKGKMGFGFLMCWQVRCRVGRLDGIGRESERFELKGESFRKVLTLPRYWRSSTDWTDMLRNWWTGIGRNMHVGFCGSSHNTIIDCFGFFLIEIYSAWLRKGLKLFMTWDGEYVKLASFTWKKGESYDRISFYSLFLVTNNSTTHCMASLSLLLWSKHSKRYALGRLYLFD